MKRSINKETIKILFVIIVLLIPIHRIRAQNITQTVKGRIVDVETKTSLPGAQIYIDNLPEIIGTISNIDGDFILENVPTGRQTIKISFIGYETYVLKNILIVSGKQSYFTIELRPNLQQLDEVVITIDKDNPINSMATVSARQFRVEETEKYASSFSDPARMAQNFAGVSGMSGEDNEIIIRGNSSRGLLWQLEGIEIPAPNHMHGGEGSSAGALSIISNTVLSNSDFFTGAFPAEYGNAISGVFDLKFRQGNFDKREYSFQAGLTGLQVSLEGPFVKEKRMSYLFNYRYSSIDLLGKLKIIDFGRTTILPGFQDVNYKLFFDTKKIGTFSVFGLAGQSKVGTDIEKDSTKWDKYDNYRSIDKYYTVVTGASHRYIFKKKKTYIKTILSYSTAFYNERDDTLDINYNPQLVYEEKYANSSYSVKSFVNHRFNLKNTIKIGAYYSIIDYNTIHKSLNDNNSFFTTYIDESGITSKLESFIQWKHKFSDKATLISGVHYLHFLLNNNYSIEPRLGFNYKFSDKITFNYGFGKHSGIEPLAIYFSNTTKENGEIYNPNKNLQLLKSIHNVVGINWKLKNNIFIKTEFYHQYLYDVPVITDSTYFTTLNMSNAYLKGKELTNKGIAYNAGLELTLEQSMNKGFYYLITASVFESKYKSLLENRWRNTVYNSNYMFNAVSGKEMYLPKGRMIGINAKVNYRGGFRLIPIDLTQSRIQGYTVYDTEKAYDIQAAAYFRIDLGIKYAKNLKNYSWMIMLDVQNVLNRKNLFQQYYNSETQQIENYEYVGIIPNINFRIEF